MRAALLLLLCAGCWDWESLGNLYEADQGTEDLAPVDLRHHDLHVPNDLSATD